MRANYSGMVTAESFWCKLTCLSLKVKILTKKLGADVGLIDVGGKTPLHWAASSSGEDAPRLVSLLIEIKPRSLFVAFLFLPRCPKMFPRSESKTVINWQDYEGRQPLHCAVTDSTDAVVAAIIKYSSQKPKRRGKNKHHSPRSPSCMLNALDNRLRSALHWAALVGRPSLIQMLLDRGAKALK